MTYLTVFGGLIVAWWALSYIIGRWLERTSQDEFPPLSEHALHHYRKQEYTKGWEYGSTWKWPVEK